VCLFNRNRPCRAPLENVLLGLRGTHHVHLGMSTTTSLAPSLLIEIRFDDGAQRESYLCVYSTVIGPVHLLWKTICLGLISGDTPWALGDVNYHLTGSCYNDGHQIRSWCIIRKLSVCLFYCRRTCPAPLENVLLGLHDGCHTMGTWGCQPHPYWLLLIW